MNFPTLASQINALKVEFARQQPATAGQARVQVAPYRITPLGAHVDHQGGEVLGRAINAFTIMVYAPDEDPEVHLRSLNYPGEVSFRLGDRKNGETGDWGRYVRGAARVLADHYRIERGLKGVVAGTLPASGLSSSASVGLVYLHALARANRLQLDAWEFIELDRRLENDYLGLDNGIQDQAIIELSHEDAFVHLDVSGPKAVYVPDHSRVKEICFLVAYSGFPRDLVSTSYNDRVAECRQSARILGKLGGLPGVRILSDIPESVYQRYHTQLPAVLQRRAHHYFGEIRRVQEGIGAWARGDYMSFGRLMTASCESSINNFETGTEEIIALQEITSQTPGVLGSRFSGGGFGGCTIGLVEAAGAQAAAENIRALFSRRCPEKEREIRVYIAAFSDGVQAR